MAALSYMQRRKSGTYEFRRRLPEALAGRTVPQHMRDDFGELINPKTSRFKGELVRSLQTKELREAKRRDHQAALDANELFERALLVLRPTASTNSQRPSLPIQPIADEVYAALLAADETERTEGDDRRHLQTTKERAQWPDLIAVPPSTQVGMVDDHFEVYGEHIADLAAEYRSAYAKRDPKIVYPETNAELKKRSIQPDPNSSEYQLLAMAILRAHVRAYDALLKRHAGEDIETPAVVETVIERGPRLSAAFALWKEGGAAVGAKKPNENTIKEAEQAVRYFTELHGDLPLADISREKARQYRDAISKVPRSLPQKLRRLPLPELLKQDLSNFEPRKAATVHKLLQIVGGIVSKAEREGHLDKAAGFSNPFGKGLRFSVEAGQSTRKHFDRADLKTILGSPVFTRRDRPAGGGGEAAFWFPLIGLLSGMRLDEIAQLRICDVRRDEETGRYYFDIGRTGGRSTKTASSIREVPVHKELVRLGLLKYRQTLLKRGASPESPLWPDVQAKGQRPRSAAWSKWFGRYLRDVCGISSPEKVFHSFRHTFKRMTRDAQIPEEQHDALTGHSNGGIGRAYGRGMSLKPLIAAMDKVTSPVDLKALQWRGLRP